MAHGLPDYYRGVDIAYQALAELITRPKYGGSQAESGTEVIAGSSNADLFTVSGKGMVYGGNVRLDETSVHYTDKVTLVLDGVDLSSLSFQTMNTYSITNPRLFPTPLQKYDNTNHIYSAGFSYGYTFEESVAVNYANNQGDSVTVYYNFYYALI